MNIFKEEVLGRWGKVGIVLTAMIVLLMVLQIVLTSYRMILVISRDGKIDWYSAKRVILTIASEVLGAQFPDKNAGIAKLVVTLFGTVISLMKQRTAEYNLYNAFDLYVDANGLNYNFNALFVKLVIGTKVLDRVKFIPDAVYLSDKETVSLVVFPNGDILYLKNKSTATVARVTNHWEKQLHDRVNHFGALSPGFDFETQLKLIWDCFPNGILFDSDEAKNELKLTSGYSDEYGDGYSKSTILKLPKVKFEELEPVEELYICNASMSLEAFSEKVKTFRQLGHQKNYLFVGSPGTGKTVFGRKLAKLDGRGCLVISGDFFRNFDYGAANALMMIEQIAPGFIICDDFDRAFDHNISGSLLMFFERMKKKPKMNQTVMLATINNIGKLGEALIRPGRFEEIVEFQTPNLSERKTLVLAFLNDAGMSIEPQQLEDFCMVLEGLSQAYIKEFCQKLIIEGNLPALIEHIKTTKRLVGEARQGENNRNNPNENGNRNYTAASKEIENQKQVIPSEDDDIGF